jgi:uncharacterized membrane protein
MLCPMRATCTVHVSWSSSLHSILYHPVTYSHILLSTVFSNAVSTCSLKFHTQTEHRIHLVLCCIFVFFSAMVLMCFVLGTLLARRKLESAFIMNCESVKFLISAVPFRTSTFMACIKNTLILTIVAQKVQGKAVRRRRLRQESEFTSVSFHCLWLRS